MHRNTVRALGVVVATCVGAYIFTWGTSGTAIAVPAFARKYQTTCAQCHTAIPHLNNYGRMFKLRGYHVPGDELLGKVDTGDQNLELLSSLPVAVVMNGRISNPGGEPGPAEVALDSEFSFFVAGSLAKNIGFFLEDVVEEEDGEFESALEFARFTFAGLMSRDPASFNLEIGTINLLDWGITDNRRFTDNGYAAYNTPIGNNGLLLAEREMGFSIYGNLGSGITPENETAAAAAAANPPATDQPTTTSADSAFSIPHGTNPYDIRKGIFYQVGIVTPGAAVGNRLHMFGRLQYAFAHGPWVGAFAYKGKSDLESGPEDFDRVSLELGWDFGKPFMSAGHEITPNILSAAWLRGHDDDPFGEGGSVDHEAQFVELAHFFTDKHAVVLRWDRVNSDDLPELNLRTITATYLYYLRRNARFGLEGVFNSETHDNTFTFFYQIGL